MRIRPSSIGILFRTELRMLLRDRRTVVVSVVLPLLVMPVMLFSAKWSNERHERRMRHAVYHYAVTGPNAPAVRSLLAATRRRLKQGNAAKGPARFPFEEMQCQDPRAALNQGRIQMVLEGVAQGPDSNKDRNPHANRRNGKADGKTVQPASGAKALGREETADAGAEDRSRSGTGPDEKDGRGLPEDSNSGAPLAVRIIYRADLDNSSTAEDRLSAALRNTQRARQAELLRQRGFPVSPGEVATVSSENVASQGQVAGLTLGRIITGFVMLFILAGGALVATDSLAGEKERGTLETLLTTAVSRGEIVAAKHLLILAVALTITFIQAANVLVYVGFKLIPIRANFAAAVTPSVGLLLFVLFLPLAALASSALLLASSYAKSYKEAQLYFFPLFLLGILPTTAALLPGLPLRSAIVVVPVANIALAAKEVLVGTFDWPMIVIAWLVTSAAAAWTMRRSVRALSAERLITVTESDAVEFAGGPALFGRRVLLWFALLWGVVLIISGYLATTDVRVQLIVNLPILFFGASVWMIRHYRLDPRQVLALRAPKPAVWLAVLVAAPSGLLTGIGLFRLASLVIPVPSKVIESFSQSVLPGDIPFWQLVFFLAVLPGIFEEITFRGVLLHGLHRRLHPAALAVVVGVVFGFFHVALFRLAPTIFLGILLAAVTLLTGSIFPAMLWHALSNTLSILPLVQQYPLTKLSPSAYLIASGILAAAFWILWRNRTPYPGLRPWRRSRREHERIPSE